MTEQHAVNTAAVLNATNPNYVRVRPLMVTPDTPLYEEYRQGTFFPMDAVEMLDELRRMVEALEMNGNICFDHFMNAPIFRQDWEGYRLPDDKEHLLSLMDEALASAGRGRLVKPETKVGGNPDMSGMRQCRE
jgi:hypothetical protein